MPAAKLRVDLAGNQVVLIAHDRAHVEAESQQCITKSCAWPAAVENFPGQVEVFKPWRFLKQRVVEGMEVGVHISLLLPCRPYGTEEPH